MNLPDIKTTFVDTFGVKYINLKEVAFDKNTICNIGNFICETIRENNIFMGDPESIMVLPDDGVYIYQSRVNPDICYRVYKCMMDYNFNSISDAKLLYALQLRQDKVKNTNFPTGVVTLDNKVIGQEMKFYRDSITVYEYIKKNSFNRKEIIDIYIKILTNIKELLDNGIYYIDIHPKNFMYNPNLKKIDIIDFEDQKVKFDDEYYKKHVLKQYISMLEILESYVFKNELNIDNRIENVSDIFETLTTFKQKLR